MKAAEIEAQARVEAARIYGKAYAGSPQLYNPLRSLDTLGTIVNGDTRLVLRTDAAPFRVLVDGPPAFPAEARRPTGAGHERRSARGAAQPWLQAGRLAFLALFGVTLLAALAWAFSNVRQIGPENRAVVLRLGALERLAGPGLLLAWPQPLEQVVLLPSAEQVIERRVEGLLRSEQARRADLDVSLSSDALAGSGYLLTGDAGVVQLDVRVFYKVDDPYAYVLQGAHVPPALDRLVARNAVQVCAARDLDTILVARPSCSGNDSAVAERRERLRGDLVQGINHSLAALAAAGSGLGIQVVRVDVQSSLPRNAVSAFNAVLDRQPTGRAERRQGAHRGGETHPGGHRGGRPHSCRSPAPRPANGWPRRAATPPASLAWPWRWARPIPACSGACTANGCRRSSARPVRSAASIRATTAA